ncbi:MAG: MoxR family ATPase [Actinomycetota bacterium]
MAGLVSNIERVILGKREAVELTVAALFAGQHVLVEGVPGVGKTMLARTIAKSIDGRFKRIQGTSDMLPTDIIGASVFDQSSSSFSFVPGPVFANVVLFDEINRTGPKTQSALLEVMDEGKVSVDGEVHEMPRPFFVIATRNPIEHHGTFPLPEGELDRFGVAIEMGYPSATAERNVVSGQLLSHPVEDLEPVISTDDVVAHQTAVRTAHVDPAIIDYIVAITSATRDRPDVSFGASTRGSLAVTRAAQAHAILRGRDYVVPDDVKFVASAVLAHRILLTDAGARSSRAEHIVQELLSTVPAPIEQAPRP